jgi:hypothetical protein
MSIQSIGIETCNEVGDHSTCLPGFVKENFRCNKDTYTQLDFDEYDIATINETYYQQPGTKCAKDYHCEGLLTCDPSKRICCRNGELTCFLSESSDRFPVCKGNYTLRNNKCSKTDGPHNTCKDGIDYTQCSAMDNADYTFSFKWRTWCADPMNCTVTECCERVEVATPVPAPATPVTPAPAPSSSTVHENDTAIVWVIVIVLVMVIFLASYSVIR